MKWLLCFSGIYSCGEGSKNGIPGLLCLFALLTKPVGCEVLEDAAIYRSECVSYREYRRVLR